MSDRITETDIQKAESDTNHAFTAMAMEFCISPAEHASAEAERLGAMRIFAEVRRLRGLIVRIHMIYTAPPGSRKRPRKRMPWLDIEAEARAIREEGAHD